MRLTARSIRNGVIAVAGMVAFYVVVAWWASGSRTHLADQLASDWYDSRRCAPPPD